MEPVTLEQLLKLTDIAVEGHILRDVAPFLEELIELRARYAELEQKFNKRCFHGDCENEMSGAYIAPVCIAYCPDHRLQAERINSLETRAQVSIPRRPVTEVMYCPECGQQHIDEGEWALRPHKTHRCVKGPAGPGCGHEWRPYDYPTVGVMVG